MSVAFDEAIVQILEVPIGLRVEVIFVQQDLGVFDNVLETKTEGAGGIDLVELRIATEGVEVAAVLVEGGEVFHIRKGLRRNSAGVVKPPRSVVQLVLRWLVQIEQVAAFRVE